MVLLLLLGRSVAPDAARKVAAGAEPVCGTVLSPDADAAVDPLVFRKSVTVNSPVMTDRDLCISGLPSEVLIHDQSSSRPLQNGR